MNMPATNTGGQNVLGSVGKAVANDAPQHLETVAPADFLTPGVGTARLTDRHFIGAARAAGHLRRYFRFETDAILTQRRKDVDQHFPKVARLKNESSRRTLPGAALPPGNPAPETAEQSKIHRGEHGGNPDHL